MQIVDHIQFGPFKSQYHRNVVSTEFKTQLEQFLRQELLPQLDAPMREPEGTLIATFGEECHCGPNSLVRDIFTLEMMLLCDDGASDLKADVVYNAPQGAFSARSGRGNYFYYFYVWTPARKKTDECERAALQRVVDDAQRNGLATLQCPICTGTIRIIHNPKYFDVRCPLNRCFVWNYHKDQKGHLAHGHFFTKHPQQRAME